MNPDNSAALAGIWSAARSFFIVLGVSLAAHGFEHSTAYSVVEFAGASIMIIGPAGWGVYRAISNFWKVTHAKVQGVKAGMIANAAGEADHPASISPARADSLIAAYAPPPVKA